MNKIHIKSQKPHTPIHCNPKSAQYQNSHHPILTNKNNNSRYILQLVVHLKTSGIDPKFLFDQLSPYIKTLTLTPKTAVTNHQFLDGVNKYNKVNK